jgi:hypothetical protein
MKRFGRIGAAMTAYQVGMAVREHWLSIPSARRERMIELVRRSGLRPSGLSSAEQAELRRLVSGLGLPLLGRRLAGIAFSKRRGRGRGRR